MIVILILERSDVIQDKLEGLIKNASCSCEYLDLSSEVSLTILIGVSTPISLLVVILVLVGIYYLCCVKKSPRSSRSRIRLNQVLASDHPTSWLQTIQQTPPYSESCSNTPSSQTLPPPPPYCRYAGGQYTGPSQPPEYSVGPLQPAYPPSSGIPYPQPDTLYPHPSGAAEYPPPPATYPPPVQS
ncbi:hypothetical protein LSH36_520g01085 [Paralvinella palmiformis]|uniref:Uncharacterized protein n=1 Tax=Paralvinella palmiformis TaxID=53620 RepID=A0AAD9J7S2_9ANNE|nr:hypothetical protein LSH36_520g01085 [Paralvinella palmiformis]